MHEIRLVKNFFDFAIFSVYTFFNLIGKAPENKLGITSVLQLFRNASLPLCKRFETKLVLAHSILCSQWLPDRTAQTSAQIRLKTEYVKISQNGQGISIFELHILKERKKLYRKSGIKISWKNS